MQTASLFVNVMRSQSTHFIQVIFLMKFCWQATYAWYAGITFDSSPYPHLFWKDIWFAERLSRTLTLYPIILTKKMEWYSHVFSAYGNMFSLFCMKIWFEIADSKFWFPELQFDLEERYLFDGYNEKKLK